MISSSAGILLRNQTNNDGVNYLNKFTGSNTKIYDVQLEVTNLLLETEKRKLNVLRMALMQQDCTTKQDLIIAINRIELQHDILIREYETHALGIIRDYNNSTDGKVSVEVMLSKNQDKYEQQKRAKPAIPTKPINIPPLPAPVVQQSSAVLQQQKINISTGATENSANVKKLTQRITEYETNNSVKPTKTINNNNNNKNVIGPSAITSSSSSSPNCSNDCCGILLNTITTTTNPCQTDKISANMKTTIYDSNNSISSSNSNGFKDENWISSGNTATATTNLQKQTFENSGGNCNIKPQNIQNIVQYQQSSKQLEHILVQRLEKDSQSPNRLTTGISYNIKNQGDHATQQQTSSIVSNTNQMKIQLKLQEEMKQQMKCIQEKFLIEKRLPQQPYKWDDSSGGMGNRSQPAIGLKQIPKLRVSANPIV